MKFIIGAVALNTKPLTDIFLETLSKTLNSCAMVYAKSEEDLEIKVVIIDNGSNDDVMELQSKYPWVKFIRNETNLGVAPAWNMIIKEGYDDSGNPTFDYYGIFNNDVYFTKHWLENYIECLKQNYDKKYGWISGFLNDHKEPELTGVVETVALENIYWQIRPNADDVKSKEQMVSILTRAYEPFGGIESFALNLKNKYGIGLREMHPKAPVFSLSKECIQKVGLFDESYTPIGLHEDADYCERIKRYSNFKFAAAYGAYAHHFSMMTRTRTEFEVPWRTAREENFQKKWTIHSKNIKDLPSTFGIKLEIGSGPKPRLEDGWYHLDVDKSAPHVEFLHNILNPLPFDDNVLEEIFCCHNIEHIEWRKTKAVLQDWYNKLKPGGKIHIRVPNFRYLAKAYLDKQWVMSFDQRAERNAMHCIFGGDREGNCFDFHKVGFDYENLSGLLRSVGFRNTIDVSGEGNWELRVEAHK